jgi:SAM-dependent methyltransferase
LMATTSADAALRERREQQFWNEQAAALEECLDEYRAGPDPNTAALVDALEPLQGKAVLDLGCGTGVLSAWLAARGARVTGLDLSAVAIDRAGELAQTLGLEVEFICGAFSEAVLEHRTFDRLAGRYVLHHLDLEAATPLLASCLVQGGKAAFVETMGTNPVLRLARKFLVGRFGIPRYGTEDERPLARTDLERLSAVVGPLRVEVAEMRFLRILDRQLLGYRWKVLSSLFGKLDDVLLGLGMTAASYHQVVVLSRRAAITNDG